MSSYLTLARTSTSLYKEKGSKFYGFAFPLQSKEEVKEFLVQIQEEHPKARHICTALLIGEGDDAYFLTNDDGEPANSAGAPILGQIRSHGITNVFIAVVRYFGGTKLGIGGLIQAYKETAAEAIAANEVVEVEVKSILRFKTSYVDLGNVLSIIDKNNLPLTVKNEATHAEITIESKAEELEAIKALFGKYDLDFQ